MTKPVQPARITPLHDGVDPGRALQLATAVARTNPDHPVARALLQQDPNNSAQPDPTTGTRLGTPVGKDGVVIGSLQALNVTVHPQGLTAQVRTAHSGPHISHRVIIGQHNWVRTQLGLPPATRADHPQPGPNPAPAPTDVVIAWNGVPQAFLPAE